LIDIDLLCSWRIFPQQGHQAPFFEQVELQQSEDLLQAPTQTRLKLQEGQKQINTQCDPDLCQDCIPAGANEGLDLQVLLGLLEEQRRLTACLVDIGNGLCRQFEIVGQENTVFAGLGIPIAD